MLAIQYLEPSPDIAALTPGAVRQRLRAAFQRVHTDLLLVGWGLPPALVDVCRDECQASGVKLYLWHPLLTGDGSLSMRLEWSTVDARGLPVSGWQGKAEFTFACPNRPQVQEAVLGRLDELLQAGGYDGLFLDRIRFPSPAANPLQGLACFCPDCYQQASRQGLDLDSVRRSLESLAVSPVGLPEILAVLFGVDGQTCPPGLLPLRRFLGFRMSSIARLVQNAARQVHAHRLGVGLDCFSPSLAVMVGQDLHALADCADWIKLMTYRHALGPAGLPFELNALAGWLIQAKGFTESQALSLLAQASGLPLPAALDELCSQGLDAQVLEDEIHRGQALLQLGSAARRPALLAGIEMVDIPGVIQLSNDQVKRSLQAVRHAHPDGLALAWDLRYMPLERLEVVEFNQ